MTTPTLSHGSHDRREDGMCLMEAVAFLAGERHSDRGATQRPPCVRLSCAVCIRTAFE
jgi:hypothetical protein